MEKAITFPAQLGILILFLFFLLWAAYRVGVEQGRIEREDSKEEENGKDLRHSNDPYGR